MCYLTAPAPTSSKVNDDPRRRAVLDVSPTSALLPPNGRVPIEVTFCPREEKFHNFNLLFNVRKKQTKLSINVKGEGFKASMWKRGAGSSAAVLRILSRLPRRVLILRILLPCVAAGTDVPCLAGKIFWVHAGISRSDSSEWQN